MALDPHKGYHFHTGRAAADRLGYDPLLYAGVLEGYADVVISNGVPNPSSAMKFGTLGISLRARKP